MSKANSSDQTDRRFAITFRAVRCPRCGSPKLRAYKTRRHIGGVTTRYVRCASCGQRGTTHEI